MQLCLQLYELLQHFRRKYYVRYYTSDYVGSNGFDVLLHNNFDPIFICVPHAYFVLEVADLLFIFHVDAVFSLALFGPALFLCGRLCRVCCGPLATLPYIIQDLFEVALVD